MASGDPPVSWQRTPCPSWCTVTHREDDHPADHWHASAQVAVVAQVPTSRAGRDRARLRVFVMVLHRSDSAQTLFLYIGDGWDQHLEARLCDFHALGDVLRTALRTWGVAAA